MLQEEEWLAVETPSTYKTAGNSRPRAPARVMAELGLVDHAAELAYSNQLQLVKVAATPQDFVFDDLRVFPDALQA